MAKKPKLGSGKRFSSLAKSVASEYRKKGKSASQARKIAGAVAASAGRKKYGAKKFSSMAQAGKKRKK